MTTLLYMVVQGSGPHLSCFLSLLCTCLYSSRWLAMIFMFQTAGWKKTQEGGKENMLFPLRVRTNICIHNFIFCWPELYHVAMHSSKRGSGIQPLFIFLSLFIYFERDRDNISGEGTEGEGERENPKQALYCLCRAHCEARTHETARS